MNTETILAALLAEDEATALAAGGDTWRRDYGGRIEDGEGRLVAGPDAVPSPEQADHITRADPTAALARVRALRELAADLVAERHLVCEDPWYTCLAATEEREGDRTARDTESQGTECDCGRDARVERRLRILASAWPGYRQEQP